MNKDESGLDARFIRKNGISSRSFCKPVMIRISYLCIRAMNLFKLENARRNSPPIYSEKRYR